MSKLRDFIHVVEREKAAIGVYVTLRRNVSARAAGPRRHAWDERMSAGVPTRG